MMHGTLYCTPLGEGDERADQVTGRVVDGVVELLLVPHVAHASHTVVVTEGEVVDLVD